MKLLYIANLRVPTEKAHGLQIMQNCEAFAQAGAMVTLWAARRVNTAEMRAVGDPWAYYGVRRDFVLSRLACLDLLMLVPDRNDWLARLMYHLQWTTFTMFAFVRALFTQADVYYSRDDYVVLALSLVKPGRSLAYEVHSLAKSALGRWMQRQAARRAGNVIPITAKLSETLLEMGAKPERLLVAHDGIRRERFNHAPSKEEARAALGWPQAAFIVGYVGRLHTMMMDKGVGTLVEALARVEGAWMALVGGPDTMAQELRGQWLDLGLEAGHFLYAGHVEPERVPLYLSAFDVCAMPHPWTEHFAYHSSPIKLFEYMASQRPIVASDLPAWADVVRDGESALLVPPKNAEALASAITRLRYDPELGRRLAACAYERVMAHYIWEARAQAILSHIGATQVVGEDERARA